MNQLFLGGTRSGKSILAEAAAKASDKHVSYIATAQLIDDDMRVRVEKHKQRRPTEWRAVEVPFALCDTLKAIDRLNRCVLIDCMSVWLGNLYHAQKLEQVELFLNILPQLQSDIIIVSSEVGLTTISENPLTRQYTDHLGEINQQLATHCQRVVLAVAGLPITIKAP